MDSQFVFDVLNQDNLRLKSKTLKQIFASKIVYTDKDINQKVMDFATLFSLFNFPILVEKGNKEYYSFEAIKDYYQWLKKAKREKSLDREVETAEDYSVKYMKEFVIICEYADKLFEKTYQRSIDLFNKRFGYDLVSPKPKLLLHFSRKDKFSKEFYYNKELNLFEMGIKFFDQPSRYHEIIIVEEVLKLLVSTTEYKNRIDIVKSVQGSFKWMRDFLPVLVFDSIKVLSNTKQQMEIVKTKSLEKPSKEVEKNLKFINKILLKMDDQARYAKFDYEILKVFINNYFEFMKEEVKTLDKFIEEYNVLEAYTLRNYIKKVDEVDNPALDFVNLLVEYKKNVQVVINYFIERFYLVFVLLYTNKYRVKSYKLDKFTDPNLKIVLKYSKNKKEWDKLFVSVVALNEINKLTRAMYRLHQFINQPIKGA